MKKLQPGLQLICLILLLGSAPFFFSACEDPDLKKCKIVGFYWEGQDYNLIYTGDRLDQMINAVSHVDLKYNEMDQLIEAYHYLPGDGATPSKWYEYQHGPDGISQIDEYRGINHTRYLLTYTSGKITQIIQQEFDPGTTTVTLEEIGTYTYNSAGNLINEYRLSGVIGDYDITDYDKYHNPFMMLANAVNSPGFFPLGTPVRFPVGTYDVSVANRLSKNNPLLGTYEISSLPPFPEEWINTYNGPLTTTIRWTYSEYGSLTGEETYKFTYDCL